MVVIIERVCSSGASSVKMLDSGVYRVDSLQVVRSQRTRPAHQSCLRGALAPCSHRLPFPEGPRRCLILHLPARRVCFPPQSVLTGDLTRPLLLQPPTQASRGRAYSVLKQSLPTLPTPPCGLMPHWKLHQPLRDWPPTLVLSLGHSRLVCLPGSSPAAVIRVPESQLERCPYPAPPPRAPALQAQTEPEN